MPQLLIGRTVEHVRHVCIHHLSIRRLGAGTRASAVASGLVLVFRTLIHLGLRYVLFLLGLGLSLRQELYEPTVTTISQHLINRSEEATCRICNDEDETYDHHRPLVAPLPRFRRGPQETGPWEVNRRTHTFPNACAGASLDHPQACAVIEQQRQQQ